MRIFKDCEFKLRPCPICLTKKKGDAVLIPINGTQDGNIAEAELFHLDCIQLLFYKKESENILAMQFGG